MKSLMIVIGFIFIFSLSAQAQKKEKIKGDKEVISVSEEIIKSFNKIEVSDNIELELQKGSRNAYILSADRNLIEEVDVRVLDETLKISTRSKITNSKKLHLFLTFENLEHIIASDDAKISNKGTLELDNLSLLASSSVRLDLDLRVLQNTEINLSGNSGGKLDLKSDHVLINMANRTDLKANLNANKLEVNLEKSASLKLDGNAEECNYNLKGSSNLNAKKLQSQRAVLNSKNNTDIYVNASKSIQVSAEGKSKVYVYGNPEIEVIGLTEKSRIIKK
ncbi:GIN domain-containing protein [Christiangramia aquimixticola]|uniref:GIN domain-containing protein n=1 Tax=Christiangramia aquimixticola TaxID=1697558 RepID=UPI003AA93601